MKVYVVIDSWRGHIEKIFDSYEKAENYAVKTYDFDYDDDALEIDGDYVELTDIFKIVPWEVE